MSGHGVRHFLDLIDLPPAELRGMIDSARAMKTASHRRNRCARLADKGDTLLGGHVLEHDLIAISGRRSYQWPAFSGLFCAFGISSFSDGMLRIATGARRTPSCSEDGQRAAAVKHEAAHS